MSSAIFKFQTIYNKSMLFNLALSLIMGTANIGGWSHFYAPESAIIFQQQHEQVNHGDVDWLYFCNGHECTEEELQDPNIMPEDCTQAQVDSGSCGMGRGR